MEALERMPFTAQKKIFKRLAEIADSSCLSKEEREKYDESQKAADDWYSGMYGSWIEGKLDDARKMKQAGLSDAQIIQFTGLTQEQINGLKK